MCGIAGIVHFEPVADTESGRLRMEQDLRRMTTALAHRGPDGEACWLSSDGRVGLGHRRLSIIDLSASAAQPMHWVDRFTIVYNGEIYNYPEIRDTLEKRGCRFRTHSDTEVLLAAYAEYGKACLDQLDGMFAFAIYDNATKKIFAARDRFGEKPFYYSMSGNAFWFASERKAFWATGLEKKINYPLLLNYLVLGRTSVPTDKTIGYFQDCYALPPAHFMELDTTSRTFSLESYWDLDKEKQIRLSEGEAVEQFQFLFRQSVNRRLRSDVGIGTSLSGGLDSSSVVATIRETDPAYSQMDTFSAIFPGFEKDESKYIGILKSALKLDNTHFEESSAIDLLDQLSSLCRFQEEPFSSASVFSQFRIFQLASTTSVKVLLDGQGADEILAGYNKYIHWFLQELLRSNRQAYAGEKKALLRNKIPFHWGWRNFLAAWYPAQVPGLLERREVRRIKSSSWIDADFRDQYLDRASIVKPLVIKLNDILYFNTCQDGLDELLRYADRNSMAWGRELRLPFLSHELAEFIFSLPSTLKIHNGYTKWLLRKSMERKLPEEILWRKDKTGFEPPQKQWMGHPVVQEAIRNARQLLVSQGILDRSITDKPVRPTEAHAPDGTDWRILIAAQTMQ